MHEPEDDAESEDGGCQREQGSGLGFLEAQDDKLARHGQHGDEYDGTHSHHCLFADTLPKSHPV
jgi:hypothetical protein